jgi:outer membrane receptor protein involved in Fe transport
MSRRFRNPPAATRRALGAVATVNASVLAILYGAPLHAAAAAAADPADEGGIQEVVVTATRRAVSAQDIPISITAVTGGALEAAGIEDIAGLAKSVSGVNYTDRGPFGGVNGSTLIIRGLNSESTAFQEGLATPVVPPVATYVDETPLFANLRLQDLERVEILRGPQGTLYGSGSLGGTIRFVQNAPDPGGFDAKVETDLGKTAHTHANNEGISGMLNIPLSDTFALRFNAGASDDAGFVNQTNLYRVNADNIPIPPANPGALQVAPQIYAEDGTNSYQYRDARLSALWKPSEEFKAQLSYYYQTAGANGFPYIATNPLAYSQPISANTQYAPNGNIPVTSNPPNILSLFPGTVPAGTDRLTNANNSLEGTFDHVNVLALTLDYDLGFATLTSATSYAHHNNQSHSDLTAEYENFPFYQNLYGQDPRTFLQTKDQLDDKVYAEEVRLASKSGTHFDWVAGLFYKDEKSYIQEHEYFPGYNQFYNACVANGGTTSDFTSVNASQCGAGEAGPLTGATTDIGIPLVVDQAYIGDFHTEYKDLAAFGEATWHITPEWSFTGGTRIFKQTVDQTQQTGLLFDANPANDQNPSNPAYVSNNAASEEWRKATWKFNTAYQLAPGTLAYATWSQGFRRGGVNALPLEEPALAYNQATTCQTGKNAGYYCLTQSLLKLQPDTADNYEVGLKGTIQNRISYSVDVFDIQWHNVQEGTSLTPLSLPASANIGEAYSRGLEFESTVAFTRHIAARVSYTYDQTKITSYDTAYLENATIPPAAVGSPLPGTPKNSVSLALEYAHAKAGDGELRYALDANYRSDILPSDSSTVPIVPGYTMLNGLVTYTQGSWLATVYVNNIVNVLGINAYTDPTFYGNRYQAVVSQPRTVGVRFGYSFKGW